MIRMIVIAMFTTCSLKVFLCNYCSESTFKFTE